MSAISNPLVADSSRVQANYPQQYEQGNASKGLVLTTQPVTRPVPVVFPTSRTFFIAPSSRMSGRRTTNEQGAVTGMRNRAKSVSTRLPKELFSPVGSSEPQHGRLKNLLNLKTAPCMFTRGYSFQNQWEPSRNLDSRELPSSSCQPQQPSTPAGSLSSPSVSSTVAFSPVNFDEATLSSPAYLQALLESPTRNSKVAAKVPKPTKYIKIHYGPLYPPGLKQQPLRTRSVDIPSPDIDRVQQQEQQSIADFDYRKYLRPARRDNSSVQEQRVTLISALPDESTFRNKAATCYAQPRRPKTLYSASTS